MGTQQVRQVIMNGTFHASLWNGSAASWVDLSMFLNRSWRDSYAQAIWSDGTTTRISGYGVIIDTARDEALLWTQAVAAPGAVTLMALGSIATRRRRLKIY